MNTRPPIGGLHWYPPTGALRVPRAFRPPPKAAPRRGACCPPTPCGLRPRCPIRGTAPRWAVHKSEATVGSARPQGIAGEIPFFCFLRNLGQRCSAVTGVWGACPPGSGAVVNPFMAGGRTGCSRRLCPPSTGHRVVHGETGHWAERWINPVPPERERWQRRTTYRVRSNGPLGRMKP
jgi:hypothetical protein